MKPLNFKNKLRSLNQLIMPPAEIGGLQISNTSIRFMKFKRAKDGSLSSKSASLRLPPGIVEDGRVKDRVNFIEALKSLHSQITPNQKETINVILTISAGDVYVETFKLPVLEGKNIDEAAKLNMQMISPNPIEMSYYNWMVVSDPSATDNKIELLGAFVLKEVVDEVTSSLEESGYAVAAIEFSSLSLKRLLFEMGAITQEEPYLIVKLTQEGLVFLIIKNGNLYFNYFYPWGKIVEQSGDVTAENALSVIGSESQRVLNFHSSHFGGGISNIILITSVFIDEISSFLRSKYQSSKVTIIKSDQDNLHGVRGAALRGLVDRKYDPEIDLLSRETVNAFWRDRILRSVDLWRNLTLTVSLFLLLVFGLSWYFINTQEVAVRLADAANPVSTKNSELAVLQAQAEEFNSLVSSLAAIREAEISLSPLVEKINTAAKPDISITRLSLRSTDLSGVVNGTALTQDSIVDFKNRLIAIPNFRDVDLPLSNITSQTGGSWSFVINFKIEPVAPLVNGSF